MTDYNPFKHDTPPQNRPAPQRQGAEYSDEWRVGSSKPATTQKSGRAKTVIRRIVETVFPVVFLAGVLGIIGYALYSVINLFNN